MSNYEELLRVFLTFIAYHINCYPLSLYLS
ncbi:Uncharacterised protein [Serratia odorifera]|uniref:Uncharacterized protein n=1 Tax=Serratia odorifera TaxID=618 RepID=A0A3S4DTG8_SEROD|nr:Uncharacterised protein [Serratia odorifera]